MSDYVFPSLPNSGLEVERETIAGKTTVFENPGGTEQRVGYQALSRYRFRLIFPTLRANVRAPAPWQSKSELDAVLWFCDTHGGARDSFLFNDDPIDSLRANLFAYSEPLLANVSHSAGVTQGALTDGGLSNGITFPATAQADNAYEAVALGSGTSYIISAFVKMADLAAPVVGTSTSTGDFGLYSDGALHTAAALVTDLGGSLYRVSSARTATVGGSRDCGVVRYAGQSGRGFTVTGLQVEAAAAVPRMYTKTSGAAFSPQKRVRFEEDSLVVRRDRGVDQWFAAELALISVL